MNMWEAEERQIQKREGPNWEIHCVELLHYSAVSFRVVKIIICMVCELEENTTKAIDSTTLQNCNEN